MSIAQALTGVRTVPFDRFRTVAWTTRFAWDGAAWDEWNHADRGTLEPGWVHPLGAQYDGVTTWPGKNGRNF